MTTYIMEYDAIESPDYPWLVLDSGLDVVDTFATESEALEEMKILEDDAEREAIIEAIDLDDLDLATLRAIRALIK